MMLGLVDISSSSLDGDAFRFLGFRLEGVDTRAKSDLWLRI